jgi:aspartate aminotransferase
MTQRVDQPFDALSRNQQVANSFMTDLGHNKLNLGLSGFRQDDGSIFVPPTTRSIERSMHMRGGLSHDALPIEGHAPFLELGLKFAYGKDGHAFKDGRVSRWICLNTLSISDPRARL